MSDDEDATALSTSLRKLRALFSETSATQQDFAFTENVESRRQVFYEDEDALMLEDVTNDWTDILDPPQWQTMAPVIQFDDNMNTYAYETMTQTRQDDQDRLDLSRLAGLNNFVQVPVASLQNDLLSVPHPHVPSYSVPEEAYMRALDLNLNQQASVQHLLTSIQNAQRRNNEIQTLVRAVMAKHLTMIQEFRSRVERNATQYNARPAVVPADHHLANYKSLRRRYAGYFVDLSGTRPALNNDSIRRLQREVHLPERPRGAAKWRTQERNALARGVRQQNYSKLAQHVLQELVQQYQLSSVDELFAINDPQVKQCMATAEAALGAIPARELEMSVENINWQIIASQWVRGRSARDCEIQWTLHDHALINQSARWTAEEEKKLKELVQQYGPFNWQRLAQLHGFQRTPTQCAIYYQRNMYAPIMRRAPWTPEEDQALLDAVARHGDHNWTTVGLAVGTRTCQQCLHRWKSINPLIHKGSWTEQEQTRLLAAIELLGTKNWSLIARHVPGRTDVQCRERWNNVLHPSIFNARFTELEDKRLHCSVAKHGVGRWSAVALDMTPRTDSQCWRRWRTLHLQDYNLRPSQAKIYKGIRKFAKTGDRSCERCHLCKLVRTGKLKFEDIEQSKAKDVVGKRHRVHEFTIHYVQHKGIGEDGEVREIENPGVMDQGGKTKKRKTAAVTKETSDVVPAMPTLVAQDTDNLNDRSISRQRRSMRAQMTPVEEVPEEPLESLTVEKSPVLGRSRRAAALKARQSFRQLLL